MLGRYPVRLSTQCRLENRYSAVIWSISAIFFAGVAQASTHKKFTFAMAIIAKVWLAPIGELTMIV
ncbi:MAG: hypothetical protein IPQ18_10795 [Saprospiraceae bacterium]|nr:hypothetical protein [Saprospiraceae bacterium]